MTRVLLIADMEGVSRIDDFRECWPIYSEYWQTGRAKLMADIVASIEGLIDGGATEVGLINGHGFGYPNIIAEDLPAGSRLLEEDEVNPALRRGAYDATLQIGRHARCGTEHGFMSHTQTPDFRVSIDGKPITESHINAWRADLPLLGVIGDAALEPELDGALKGTPFMAVKHADSRVDVSPIHGSAEDSAAAIRAFSAWCMANSEKRQPPPLPQRFIFACCLNGALAELAIGQHGLMRTSPSVLVKSSTDWWVETEPALQAAMAASMQPWLAAWRGIDYSSEAALAEQDPNRLERARQFIHQWFHRKEVTWRH
jgi:D-aminopeptidase